MTQRTDIACPIGATRMGATKRTMRKCERCGYLYEIV
jgi:Fe-S-cluster-containing dehydrogenase component